MRDLRLVTRALAIATVIVCTSAIAAGAQSGAEIAGDAALLVKLAQAQFGHLSPAETKLLRTAPTGYTTWYGPSKDPKAPSNDPAKAANWGSERVIRAEVFRWLAIDPHASSKVHPAGMRIGGVKIEKMLDLAFQKIEFPIKIANSAIPEGIDLTRAKTREIILSGSWIGPIYAEESAIEGDVHFDRGFRATGEVDLGSSVIEGSLNCINGASFLNASGYAIHAYRARIKGDVFLGATPVSAGEKIPPPDFRADGQVSLFDAQIDGSFTSSGGQFRGRGKSGLNLSEARIERDVGFSEISSDGLVDMSYSQVGANVALLDSSFTGFNGEFMTVHGLFQINRSKFAGRTELILDSATAGTLYDDQASWPDAGSLSIDGFTYGRFDPRSPADAQRRLDWLSRQRGYRPQPYEQLATVFRESGREADATEVLIAKEDALLARGKLTPTQRFGKWTLGWLSSYGYKPLRAFLPILFFWAVGVLLFSWGYGRQAIVPTKEKAFESFEKDRSLPIYYQPFSAIVYSLETFLPLVDLKQGSNWTPAHRDGDWRGGFLRRYQWIHILAGWVFTTMFVAGLTGLITKGSG